jgi:DNA polymerase-3 subunit epsilon
MTKIAVLDLETTGTDYTAGDRIVEIGIKLFDVHIHGSGTRLRLDGEETLEHRVNPERLIHPDASEVHGIRNIDVMGKPRFKDIAKEVHQFLSQSKLMVAHNMNFDGPFLGNELMMAGLVPPDIPTFCTMENARWATGTGKLPKLGELCYALDVEYDPQKAHGAIYDLDRTFECFVQGFHLGYYKPRWSK